MSRFTWTFRDGDRLKFPAMGIVIEVVKATKGGRARLIVEAPDEVRLQINDNKPQRVKEPVANTELAEIVRKVVEPIRCVGDAAVYRPGGD